MGAISNLYKNKPKHDYTALINCMIKNQNNSGADVYQIKLIKKTN